MATRLPASQRTREELTALIEGRLSTASAKDELIKLASRLIVEEALEGEAGDALGREYLCIPKIPSGRIRTVRENQRIINFDGRAPPIARIVCRRPVQVATAT